MFKVWLRRFGLTIMLVPLLYSLGKCLPYSGDGHYTVELANKNWVMLMHSPLTTFVHKTVYELMRPFGWNAWQAVSLSSSIAGAIAIQILYEIRPHPLFLAINILSGSFWVFFGEVENYAWVNCCLIASFLYFERYLGAQSRLWPAMTFLFLACLFHGLALFYLPAYLWFLYKRQDFHPLEFLYPISVYIAGLLVLDLGFPHEGFSFTLQRLVPLFSIQYKGQFFTFFSYAHWEILYFFHRRAGFLWLPVPVEIPCFFLLRKHIDSPFKQFLAICSIIGIGWTTVWHPDLGKLDWDLFSQFGISLHILLGILIIGRISGLRSKSGL